MAEAGTQRVTSAMSHLAESLQGLVGHLRSEQVLIKQLIEAQGRQQAELTRVADRLDAAARAASQPVERS